jgi:hypothetical protein
MDELLERMGAGLVTLNAPRDNRRDRLLDRLPEPSLAKAFKALWRLVPGNSLRTATSRRGRNIVTTVRVGEGEPDVLVVQRTPRTWHITIRLPSPKEWQLETYSRPRARRRGAPDPCMGLVLHSAETALGRKLWVLERPHAARNEFRVYTVLVPSSVPSTGAEAVTT